MRMGVLLNWPAMSSPSGVSHPYWPGHLVKVVFRVNFLQPTVVLLDIDLVAVNCNLPNRVVATILKPLQSGPNHRGRMLPIMEFATEYSAQLESLGSRLALGLWEGVH